MFSINIEPKFSIKNFDFINDKKLQLVLKDRLDELDRVFVTNANLSTIMLSISCIEGIFRHLANLFKAQIQNSSLYPLSKGKPRDIDKLTIEVIYKLLTEQDILKEIENFVNIYKLFRKYRNFIHPEAQVREDWPVGIGQAQMALGLLNATMDQISKYLFIGTKIFEIISGRPRYDLSNTLHLDMADRYVRTNSFMVLKHAHTPIMKSKFNLELGENSVFNFVFNFSDIGAFKMLRLDKRKGPGERNALLYCKQPYLWDFEADAEDKNPPSGEIEVETEVNTDTKKFIFLVNGKAYKFNKGGREINLYDEFDPNLKIGWFNEKEAIKLKNLEINYL
jgi:hypothetical protein